MTLKALSPYNLAAVVILLVAVAGKLLFLLTLSATREIARVIDLVK